jgi:hypothetical protein
MSLPIKILLIVLAAVLAVFATALVWGAFGPVTTEMHSGPAVRVR